MAQSHRPLTPRERALAEAWRGKGTGVHAARAAGFQGKDSSLRTIASKVMKHPEAQAIIAARRADEQVDAEVSRVLDALPELDGADATGVGVNPLAVYAEVARDREAIPAARVAAAYRIERAMADANPSSADPFADLRAKMNELIRAKRARERDEE